MMHGLHDDRYIHPEGPLVDVLGMENDDLFEIGDNAQSITSQFSVTPGLILMRHQCSVS